MVLSIASAPASRFDHIRQDDNPKCHLHCCRSTVAAAQVGFGSTVAAAGAGNCPTGAVGTKTDPRVCIIINVAGTSQVVPYF